MRDLKESNISQIKYYLYQIRWMFVIVGVTVLMTHGSILFTQRFGIDTDYIMNGRHNFDMIGRQGLVWLAKLLGLEWFNLYYAQILTLLFMAFAPVAFGYLFYRANERNVHLNLSLFVLSVSFIVSPFWTAQIYFLNQSAQILFACILIPVSFLLAEAARTDLKHKWYCIILAILLMNVIFACYQVLIMVYVTGATVVFLLYLLKERPNVKRQLRWIGFHTGCILIGFASYFTISRLFYMSGSVYLINQLEWTRASVSEVIRQCLAAVRGTLQNNPPNYSGFYGIYALLLLVVTIYWLSTTGRLKKGGNCVSILLAEIFLVITPYIFIFFYGTEIVDRMQLVMPLSQGSMLYLTVMLFPNVRAQKKTFKRLAASVVGLGLVLAMYKDTVFHLSYCNRFYYTDEWVFEYDNQISQKIYFDIQDVVASTDLEDSFDNYLFLGYPSIPYNSASLRGSAIGYSHYQYDIEYLNRERIIYLMRNLGYPVASDFTSEERAAFQSYFEEYFGEVVDAMPSYPTSGYIQYLSNDEIGLKYLVIKLGEYWRLV